KTYTDQELPAHELASQASGDSAVPGHGTPRTSTSPTTSSMIPSWLRSAYTWEEPRDASSEPRPLDRSIPWFAGRMADRLFVAIEVAALASSIPAPAAVAGAFTRIFGSAVFTRMAFTMSGLRDGFAAITLAATPETMAVAWDVPVPLK